jgi:hypothetical protein
MSVRTPEQIRAMQQADAEEDFGKQRARTTAALPATAEPTAITIPDSRTASQAWQRRQWQ